MLNKLKLALLISAPLVAGATTYALANDAPAPGAVIQKFDKNGDGKLDDAERTAMRDSLVTERFQKLDKNGDGALSLDEFKAGKQGFRHHGRHGHRHMRGAAPGAGQGGGATE